MASEPKVERFKGTTWEECHEFILAIRTRAMWEGKQRDSAWMADFAASYFWRKALSWHGRLPLDVRQDWFKLEAALLDRWPSPEDDDGPEIQPTPAAAPSLSYTRKAESLLLGVLKVVVDGSNTNYYVKPPEDHVCQLTSDRNKAIRIRYNSLPCATLLEPVDRSRHSWLAVQWSIFTPTIGDGSPDCAYIVCIVSDALKSSWDVGTPLQLLTCNFGAGGEIIPVWKKSDSSEITFSAFVRNDLLFLVTDPVVYGRENTGEERAKLFIDSID